MRHPGNNEEVVRQPGRGASPTGTPLAELDLRPKGEDYAALDQTGVKVAVVSNTTTMRGVQAHLKHATVTGYQTFDEIFNLLKGGEIDAFALSRDQLNDIARKIPGARVLAETFKKTIWAVAVPLNHPQSLVFATKFMADAIANGTLRNAYDNNGMKDAPIRTE